MSSLWLLRLLNTCWEGVDWWAPSRSRLLTEQTRTLSGPRDRKRESSYLLLTVRVIAFWPVSSLCCWSGRGQLLFSPSSTVSQ